MKVWCDNNKIENFSSYALRKAWATLARRFENKPIVDEAIGHTGGSRMLDIYAEKPYDRYHELNRKVLALFEWE
jgi:integrase